MFDSSINLILRGGFLMSIGDFPEGVSRAVLGGIILVGRLGVGPIWYGQSRVQTQSHEHTMAPCSLLWGILTSTLKLGQLGRDSENTSDIEMSVYFADTGKARGNRHVKTWFE